MSEETEQMTSRPTTRRGASAARRPGPDRGTALALASVVVPPLAWIMSLAASYVIQDFTCTNFASAGRPGPDGPVLWLILGLNAVLLILAVLAGAAGWRQWRTGHRTVRYLGLVGAGASLLFVLGIVLIAMPPLFLEVCP